MKPIKIAIVLAVGALAPLTAGLAQQAPAPARSFEPYLTAPTNAPLPPDADGFLQRWLLLEPIVKPNRSNIGFTQSYVRAALTDFPGGTVAVPRDGALIKTPEPLRWHALDARLFDVKLFNFAQSLGKPVYGVIFHAVTVVDSPREMHNVRLAVGSNAASMWWVNGTEAVGLYGDRRMVMDDGVSQPLTLHKGRNIVRGAVINGPGLSDFCVRFVDAEGRPVRDLTIDLK